jgi:hypothetical protein
VVEALADRRILAGLPADPRRSFCREPLPLAATETATEVGMAR